MVRDFSTQEIKPEAKNCRPVLIVGFYSDHFIERHNRLEAVFSIATKIPRAQILFVGGWRPKAKIKIGAKQMAADLIKLGISADRISSDTNSNDTISNIESVVKQIELDPVCKLVLVSSPSHLVRIRFFINSLRQQTDVMLLASLPNTTHWAQFWALHYEMAAYIVNLLPREWSKSGIDSFRQSRLFQYQGRPKPAGQVHVT